ncbi:MAG: hypothetical protein WKF97_23990 [Chitinophagaceae bacterium]
MSYLPLTDPFILRFSKDGIDYEAKVIYAKSTDCCKHFFDVTIQKPEGIKSFHLKEKPTSGPGSENMIWIDENDQVKMFYQVLGYEIEQYMRKNLGILLIDAPVADQEVDHMRDKEND